MSFYANGMTDSWGPLHSFSVGAGLQKNQTIIAGWNFQPHSQPLGMAEGD